MICEEFLSCHHTKLTNHCKNIPGKFNEEKKEMSRSVPLNNLLLQTHIHTTLNQLSHLREREGTNGASK
jgi:hypothetical protein